MLQAAPEAIYRPCRDNVEFPARNRLQHGVQLRALVPALRTADAMVYVLADDLPAVPLRRSAIHRKEILMADDLKKTGRHDDDRINVDQDHEGGYWAEKLGFSREQLRQAVQAAGPMVKDVQRHLNR